MLPYNDMLTMLPSPDLNILKEYFAGTGGGRWTIYQNVSSYGLGLKVFWRYFHKWTLNRWMNELINDEGPWRTTLATPGLFMTKKKPQKVHKYYKKKLYQTPWDCPLFIDFCIHPHGLMPFWLIKKYIFLGGPCLTDMFFLDLCFKFHW